LKNAFVIEVLIREDHECVDNRARDMDT